jgi:hypothetical protein
VAVPRVAGPSSCSRVLGSRQPVRGGRHSADRVSSRLGRPPANATCRGCLSPRRLPCDRDPQRQEAIGPRYGGQGDGTGSRGSCSRTICDGSFRNSGRAAGGGASIQGAHRGLSASPGSRTEPSRQQPTVPKPPCAGSRIAGSRPASWPPSKQSQQRWDTRSDWSRKGISRGWHSTRR